MAPTAGTISLRPHCGRSGLSRIAWKISHSETKPLSGGSAEIAMHAAEEREGGLRHAVDEPAELLDVALAGRRQHGAGAEEQQALEQAVIEDVEQRRRHGERGGAGMPLAVKASARPRPMKMMPMFSTV